MLTLIVKTDDGARRKAVVKAGQEITIIRANPFLEKQGDYSLDIDLPLGHASTIRITIGDTDISLSPSASDEMICRIIQAVRHA